MALIQHVDHSVGRCFCRQLMPDVNIVTITLISRAFLVSHMPPADVQTWIPRGETIFLEKCDPVPQYTEYLGGSEREYDDFRWKVFGHKTSGALFFVPNRIPSKLERSMWKLKRRLMSKETMFHTFWTFTIDEDHLPYAKAHFSEHMNRFWMALRRWHHPDKEAILRPFKGVARQFAEQFAQEAGDDVVEDNFFYAWRIEFGGKNGRIHVHALCSHYIPYRTVRQAWQLGFVWVKPITKTDKIRTYISKLLGYTSKSEKDHSCGPDEQSWLDKKAAKINMSALDATRIFTRRWGVSHNIPPVPSAYALLGFGNDFKTVVTRTKTVFVRGLPIEIPYQLHVDSQLVQFAHAALEREELSFFVKRNKLDFYGGGLSPPAVRPVMNEYQDIPQF